jgi:hypothetical protein
MYNTRSAREKHLKTKETKLSYNIRTSPSLNKMLHPIFKTRIRSLTSLENQESQLLLEEPLASK